MNPRDTFRVYLNTFGRTVSMSLGGHAQTGCVDFQALMYLMSTMDGQTEYYRGMP